MAPLKDVIYVGITDFHNQRFVVEVPTKTESTAASLGYERTPKQALNYVYDLVKGEEPIECEIVHPNNKAKMTVIFLGPVRLDVG